MRAWRLVLTGRDRSTVGLGQATVRFFAGWISILPAGLGFLWSLIDRERLTWHDRLSKTALELKPKSAQAGDSQQRDEQ
jgi:uncharacterized RDD family membrane protein YckC